MPVLKQRVIVGILGLAIAFGLIACDPDRPDTTSPGGPATTEPVGS
jgi:hypothetical protein